MGTRHSVHVEAGMPTFVGILGVVALGLWARSYYAPVDVAPRDLGLNTIHASKAAITGTSTLAAPIPLPGVTGVDLAVEKLPGDWNGFRGPNRDNIGPPGSVVANGVDQIQTVWQVGLGEGY